MTTIAPLTDSRIDSYLSRLAAALSGVAAAEKDEIVREIRAHILDSVSTAADPAGATDRVLRLLGAPEELANRYTTESLLTRARSSFSPWLLLLTCWRWAKLGMKGTFAFLLAFIGYTTALTLTGAVFLKPFVPKIGWWSGPAGFGIMVPDNPQQMHELLGPWFVPVIAAAAFAAAVGTTHALRWMIRKRVSTPMYEIPQAGVSGPAQI
jgi:hypothetical protein